MDAENNVFEHGSTWLKGDFHLHTRADKEFNYQGPANEFCNRYVEQLAAQEIGVGVITNHNKFDKEEFKALRAKASKKGIGLFPGVEFSLKEGIHILIVFDDDWYKGEAELITKFLENAFYGVSNYSTPPYPNSKLDLAKTVEALDAIDHDYFIILAHINDRNGLFEVLEKRTLDTFIKEEAFNKVLAVQKSGNPENYKRLCKQAEREIACIEGSDNAHGGIEAIGNGKRVSFIKIGDFSFEALKYALTDHEFRVKPKEKPKIENSYIKSIEFEGGLLDGKVIGLSPELNNFIGIRGSGKSSILEIIRYTLGISLNEKTADFQYKNGLVEHVLRSGGKVVLKLVNEHGEEYQVEKIYTQKEDIYKDGVLQHEISIDAFFKRPVYFGQKDLSNKDADFEADLIERLIGSRLKEVQSEIRSKQSEIKNTILEIGKLRDLAEKKNDTERTITDNEHKLKIYKEKGVEQKLKQQADFDSDLDRITETSFVIKEFSNDLKAVIDEYDQFFSQSHEGSELTKQEYNSANQLVEKLKLEFDKLKLIQKQAAEVYASFIQVVFQLQSKKETLKDDFAKIKREINLPNLNPDNFLSLNRLIQTAKLTLGEIAKSEARRKYLQKTLDQKLSDLNNLWLKEYRELEKEVDKINSADSKLTIEIKFKGNREKFLNKLKQVAKGANIYKNTYEDIAGEYADFIEIFKKVKPLERLLNQKQLVDFQRRFQDHLSELLTYKVENEVVIKYNNKPLKDHSLGQRASALILFLLAQRENDVLLIDQPEDDLDNQTIYKDVIREIRKLKGEMQFIFATHNANIPVLGDSEKVIACEYIENKEIDLQMGTIDEHQMQKRIVDVMEGGTRAFNLRKKIYDIWNVEE